MSPSFNKPEFHSCCLDRNPAQYERVSRSTNETMNSVLHLVDVSRFFVASDHSAEAGSDSHRLPISDQTDVDDLTAASYVRLDVLRIVLAVVDVFVILHRCACLDCCGCCWQSDNDKLAEASLGGNEVMRNGSAGGGGGSGGVGRSKHDPAGQQRTPIGSRAPNGIGPRPLSTIDVYDDNDDVPDGMCPLRRRRRRRKGTSTKAARRRRRVAGGKWHRQWTLERRQQRRRLLGLWRSSILCLKSLDPKKSV